MIGERLCLRTKAVVEDRGLIILIRTCSFITEVVEEEDSVEVVDNVCTSTLDRGCGILRGWNARDVGRYFGMRWKLSLVINGRIVMHSRRVRSHQQLQVKSTP